MFCWRYTSPNVNILNLIVVKDSEMKILYYMGSGGDLFFVLRSFFCKMILILSAELSSSWQV